MNGVTFGTKHSYDDLDLILSSKEVGLPEPKTETVDVPGADGSLDLTGALTDEIKYENRTLTFTFTLLDALDRWADKLQEVKEYLHGQKMRVIMDDDAAFYYYGRCKINSYTSSQTLGTLVIEVNAEPYKIDLNSLTEAGTDWLWDPFSFLTGCIYTDTYTISGETTITLYCPGMPVSPTFVSDSDMTITFDGTDYDLEANTETTWYEIRLSAGENTITVSGSGTLVITYEGGSL